MTKGVLSVKLNASIRRGITLIVKTMVNDFDNGFDDLFPEASDRQIVDLCAAISWLEQHANDDIYS